MSTPASPIDSAPTASVSEPADARASTQATDEGEDREAFESTIAIELNFNAFADHVPPNKHARRVGNSYDPSVQDFADQALELAALRAELKRLNRDYEALKQTVRLRDAQLQALRERLAARQVEIGSTTRRIFDEPAPASGHAAEDPGRGSEDSRAASTSAKATPIAATPPSEPSPTLEMAGPQFDATATLSDIAHTQSQVLPASNQRQLIPVDHEGNTIALSRDIMTVGRTRQNDICIPSRAVSRDHARLLISTHSVTIVDIGSANGCFVNDQPIKKQRLRDGDIVRIGDRAYRFAANG